MTLAPSVYASSAPTSIARKAILLAFGGNVIERYPTLVSQLEHNSPRSRRTRLRNWDQAKSLAEQVATHLQFLDGSSAEASAIAAHSTDQGVKVFGWLALRPLDFGLFKARRDCRDYAGRDLILQLEDVIQRSVKPIGPQMCSGSGIDELASDTNLAAAFLTLPSST